MKSKVGLAAVMFFFTVGSACVTSTTTSRTWGAPAGYGDWSRPGHVEWVRETVHRQDGDPVGGAIAGAIIGGLLFGGHHHGPGALIGAAGGAAVGAAASSGSAESRSYEVAVRFDDGGFQVCVFQGYLPFQPGQPVVMTPRGLAPR